MTCKIHKSLANLYLGASKRVKLLAITLVVGRQTFSLRLGRSVSAILTALGVPPDARHLDQGHPKRRGETMVRSLCAPAEFGGRLSGRDTRVDHEVARANKRRLLDGNAP